MRHRNVDTKYVLHTVVASGSEAGPDRVWRDIHVHMGKYPRHSPWDTGEEVLLDHRAHHHLLVLVREEAPGLAVELKRNLEAVVGAVSGRDEVWYPVRVEVVHVPALEHAWIAMFGRAVWLADDEPGAGYLEIIDPHGIRAEPVWPDGDAAVWHHGQTAICVLRAEARDADAIGNAIEKRPAPFACPGSGPQVRFFIGKTDDFAEPVVGCLDPGDSGDDRDGVRRLEPMAVEGVDGTGANWWLWEGNDMLAKSGNRTLAFRLSTDESPTRIWSDPRTGGWPGNAGKMRLAVHGIALPDPEPPDREPDVGRGATDGAGRVVRGWIDLDADGRIVWSPLQPRRYAVLVEEKRTMRRWREHMNWRQPGPEAARLVYTYEYLAAKGLVKIRTPVFTVAGRRFSLLQHAAGEWHAPFHCLLVQAHGTPLGYIELDEKWRDFGVSTEPNSDPHVISLAWLDHAGRVETDSGLVGLARWCSSAARIHRRLTIDHTRGEVELRGSDGHRATIPFRSTGDAKHTRFFLGPLLVQLIVE